MASTAVGSSLHISLSDSHYVHRSLEACVLAPANSLSCNSLRTRRLDIHPCQDYISTNWDDLDMLSMTVLIIIILVVAQESQDSSWCKKAFTGERIYSPSALFHATHFHHDFQKKRYTYVPCCTNYKILVWNRPRYWVHQDQDDRLHYNILRSPMAGASPTTNSTRLTYSRSRQGTSWFLQFFWWMFITA
jgi:hypothetical protein